MRVHRKLDCCNYFMLSVVSVMELQLGLSLFPCIKKFEEINNKRESESESESESEPPPYKDVCGSSFHNDDVPQTLPLFSQDKQHSTCHDSDDHENSPKRIIRECTKAIYVKVKMEGVAIARKVDLTQYHSYHTLANTLLLMFGKSEDNMKDYELTYRDQEGDWLLAEDIPWKSFVQSVQCLKWIKKPCLDWHRD